jgi:fatty acid/phospholipid biosynthesis enzyme
MGEDGKLKVLKAVAEGAARGIATVALDRLQRVERPVIIDVKPTFKDRVRRWFK